MSDQGLMGPLFLSIDGHMKKTSGLLVDLNGAVCIIALKASGRDCTNNNELLHKIGVLHRLCHARIRIY